MSLETLKAWLCPDKCMVCGCLLEGNEACGLCPSCETGLLVRDVCPKCGKPYATNTGACGYCNEVPAQVTCVRALFPYIDLYKESVLRWKYTGIRKYAKGYGALLSTFIQAEHLEIDYLIPIPIARHRYLDRGFNQALDLADEVAKRTHIPVWDVLARSHDTKPQSACKKEERAKNIRGAIKMRTHTFCETSVKIALIDDIYTTGSTVRECIRVLQRESNIQIEQIYVLAVCLAI
ncbi:MAG: ComF family protein [Niameybacter sp.]